jgi:hypothetical protein
MGKRDSRVVREGVPCMKDKSDMNMVKTGKNAATITPRKE